MPPAVVSGSLPEGTNGRCGLKEMGLVMPCCIKLEEPEGSRVNEGRDQHPPPPRGRRLQTLCNPSPKSEYQQRHQQRKATSSLRLRRHQHPATSCNLLGV